MAEIVKREKYKYTGNTKPGSTEVDRRGRPLEPYLPSSDLVRDVNLAIQLKRPLLIMGDPGCGKTRLARAVAYELAAKYGYGAKWETYFKAWYVKSTSRARDGLYTYDAVGRLRDAQLAASKQLSPKQLAASKNPKTYVKWGPLGEAFLADRPCVVLIDEIDKADIDFPNDLLLELDEHFFIVDEVEKKEDLEVTARHDPIVFVTSNREKDLPDAFLRRCLFHFIEFPKKPELTAIVKAHYPRTAEDLVSAAIDRFLELRDLMETGRVAKKASTSELLDWVRVLGHYRQEDNVLAKIREELLYPGVLLKNWDDYRHFTGLMQKEKPESAG